MLTLNKLQDMAKETLTVENLRGFGKTWLNWGNLKAFAKEKPKKAAIIALILLFVIYIGGKWMFGAESESEVATSEVKRGPLKISITEAGTIQPKEKLIVKNEVEGQTTVTSLVDEGITVKKGDLLIELDASTLSDNKVDQEISTQNAEASLIDAQESYAVAENQAKSDIASAQLTYDFAVQDLDKYIKGEYPNAKKSAESSITLAEENLKEAQETLQWSEKLYKDKFLSQTELDSDRLSEKQKDLSLQLAKNDLELLEKYTYKRKIAQLESDVSQAKMALERVTRSTKASVVQAEANLKAKQAEYDRQKSKLEKIVAQLSKTKIYAPADGTVVYATSSTQGGGRFGMRQEPLDVGSSVQERQELIHLPTTTGYTAEISIEEGSIDKVKVGMPATVTVDTIPGKIFSGKVKSVSNVVNAQSAFMNPDLKVYDTVILLDDSEDLTLLRSDMSCTAEVIIAQYPDALYIPVQSVLQVNGKPTVYLSNLKPKTVETGLDNNIVIRILKGLKEGDEVSLTPPLTEAAVVAQDYESISDVDMSAVAATGTEAAAGKEAAAQGTASGNQAAPQGQQGAAGQQTGQKSGGARMSMTDMDKDGDGKISSSEFSGPTEMFSRIDKDSDGYISSSELPTGAPGGGQGQQSGQQGQMPSGGQGQQSGGPQTGQMSGGQETSSQGGMSGFGAPGGAQ